MEYIYAKTIDLPQEERSKLLRVAIAIYGKSKIQFAKDVLKVKPSTIYSYLAGRRNMPDQVIKSATRFILLDNIFTMQNWIVVG